MTLKARLAKLEAMRKPSRPFAHLTDEQLDAEIQGLCVSLAHELGLSHVTEGDRLRPGAMDHLAGHYPPLQDLAKAARAGLFDRYAIEDRDLAPCAGWTDPLAVRISAMDQIAPRADPDSAAHAEQSNPRGAFRFDERTDIERLNEMARNQR